MLGLSAIFKVSVGPMVERQKADGYALQGEVRESGTDTKHGDRGIQDEFPRAESKPFHSPGLFWFWLNW